MGISVDGVCPECGRRLEEYLANVPEGKYVSVDVPLDVLEAEKVIGIKELRVIVDYLNATRGFSGIRLRVPDEVA